MNHTREAHHANCAATVACLNLRASYTQPQSVRGFWLEGRKKESYTIDRTSFSSTNWLRTIAGRRCVQFPCLPCDIQVRVAVCVAGHASPGNSALLSVGPRTQLGRGCTLGWNIIQCGKNLRCQIKPYRKSALSASKKSNLLNAVIHAGHFLRT